MPKIDSTVTGDISDLAVSGESLEDILKALELPREYVSNDEVLETYNAALLHLYLEEKFKGVSDEDIIQDHHITQLQCDTWGITHNETITLHLLQISQDTKEAAQQFSDPILSGINNMAAQDRGINNRTSKIVVAEGVSDIVAKLKSGNTEDMLTVLVTQTLQLQMLTNKITKTVANTDRYDLMQKFQNIQIKAMAETRKTVMAISEVCNPKRTTFIKEASQHNHLQINSQEKTTPLNELYQPKEGVQDAYQYTEAETVTEGTHKPS